MLNSSDFVTEISVALEKSFSPYLLFSSISPHSDFMRQ